jgi:integrase
VKREEARQLLAKGIDPSAVKKATKQAGSERAANSFELVAREWHEKFKPTWAESSINQTIRYLELDVFPWIGGRPVAEIEAPELLAVLRKIESRGALSVTHRVRAICGQIFRYAVATGRAKRDPSGDLRGAIPPPSKNHYPAITEPKELAALLKTIDIYTGSPVIKTALLFGALTAVRPGEMSTAEWNEIDFESATWNIPAERMKMNVAHVVPLSRQALTVLEELKPLTGASKYIFPNGRSFAKPLSMGGVLMALASMGYRNRHSGHGWRATFRTILDEVLGERVDLIEHQLAHAVKDPNGRAYNRTSHLPERRKMMQKWADYLDGLKQGAKVIPFKKVIGE